MVRILLLIIGYGFGLIQTGYFYGKIKGKDLTQEGSGNTGATNALRVFGWKGAAVVYLFDMLKAFVPCLLLRLLLESGNLPAFFGNVSNPAWSYIAMFYLAFGCILGNDFPFYRHFKGGKGIAATSGIILAWNVPIFFIAILVFAIITGISGYVSLASIVCCLVFVISTFVFGKITWGTAWISGNTWEFYILAILIAAVLIFRHKDNIKRLLNGTENRFGKHKKLN